MRIIAVQSSNFRVSDASERAQHEKRKHSVVGAFRNFRKFCRRENLDRPIPIIRDRHRFNFIVILWQISLRLGKGEQPIH